MKRTSFFAAAVAATMILCVACNRLEMPDMYPVASEQEAPQKYVPVVSQFVDVPLGCKSMVIVDGKVVATLNTPGYVVLPKVKETRAVSGYQIVSMPNESDSGVASENELEMVLAFEDTKTGDHDYNDLVVQAHMNITNMVAGSGTVDIDITPVAMGATTLLGLGVVLTDADGAVIKDHIITSDCRSFFFKNDEGFINTGDTRKKYEQVSMTVSTESNASIAGVSWYLISGGQKLYASNSLYACLDEDDFPQGLVLMNLRNDFYYELDGEEKIFCGNDFWQYPVESENIADVYPDFEKAFIEGGDFSVFAVPSGKFYDAIAAADDGCLSSDCLYDVYEAEEEEGEAAESYYDNTGKACKVPQSFEALFNTFDHSKDNFILEFSNAKGNAIDFDNGDIVEAKITYANQQLYFNMGDIDVNNAGKAIEVYSNDKRNWFRIQDAFNTAALGNGKTYEDPMILRISKAQGIEFFYSGKFEQILAPSNEVFASILELGTDKPLYLGLFGNKYESASYEYLKVFRVTEQGPINPGTVDSDIHVKSVSVEDKILLVGEKATLTATVLPDNATNKSVTWSSSNEAVATVNATTGEVEGIGKGHCTITATSVDNPDITGSCLVTVTTETNEVMIWQDFETNKTTVDVKQLEIIASGTPSAGQICFNNGDYIEAKIHRMEVPSTDKDLLYVGSVKSEQAPYVCLIGHNQNNTEIYMIPGYWWSVASFKNTGVDQDFYVRFGCKADMTKGCGSWSNDGVNWTTFKNGNDFEAEWTKMTDPAKSPLIIQTARKASYLQLSKYEYVKIVRAGATVE